MFNFASGFQQIVVLVLVGIFVSTALKIVLIPVCSEAGARLASSVLLFVMALLLCSRIENQAVVWQSAFVAQVASDIAGPLRNVLQELLGSLNNFSS